MSRKLDGSGGDDADPADLLRELEGLGGGAPSLPPPPPTAPASPPSSSGAQRPPEAAQRSSPPAARHAMADPPSGMQPGDQSSRPPDSADDPETARQRRATGRRQARLARIRRRRRIRRLAVTVAAVVVAAAGLVVVTAIIGRQVRDAFAPEPTPETAVAGEQATLLLVRHPERGGPATGATLLAVGPEESTASVVFIPVGTLMDLPGFGLDQLALAHQYGGPGLVASTIENALGIHIDHVAAFSDEGLGAFLDRSGGFEVEVREQLVERADDGSATVVFQPGLQHLDGDRLAQLWSFRARGEDELASFTRQQQVVRRLLEVAGDPDVLQSLVGDGAPLLGTAADPAWMRQLFSGMAAAAEAERLTFSMLPVELFGGTGADGSASYRMDDEETQRLIGRLLAASVPEGAAAGLRRVQVLNGVGTPAAGQVVDAKLQGSGFRIILNDNADSFDYDDTLIIIYREDEAALAAAERVQELLGVGTIRVSRQPQSVVDLTIVVGSDLAPATGESVDPLGTIEPVEPDEAEETEPE
ncbi:MAG TPA: LCP family protein [Egibacteraceae bacterium]|nr:LCP family protein [Egibacteraceae bacterium]